MNSRSNLAYEHPAQIPQKQSNVRIRISKKKKQSAQKRERALSIVKILLVVSCAFVVLYRGVMITDKCAAVDTKKTELEELVASNKKLQFEIDRSLDLKNVEAIAQNELGMRRAEKYQTVYIDLEQVDYVEKTAKNEFSPASRVAEFITGLAAYLD